VPAQILQQSQPIALVVDGHHEVCDDQIAFPLTQPFNQLMWRTGFTDYLEFRILLKHGTQPYQEDRVVVR
jgi:hypothetical protein